MSEFSQNIKVPVAIYLLACLVGLFLVLAQTGHIRNSERYKEYGSEQPLLTNYDGYYFLRIAERLGGEEGLAKFGLPRPVPLLSKFTNSLSQVTGISHKSLAFYMPPVLATLSLVVLLVWASALGGHVASLVTLLFLITSPHWGVQTSLGIFDTHFLIPFFIYGFALCLYKFTVDRGLSRVAWLVAALCFSFLSASWWRPSLFICATIAGIYPVTVFMKTARWERVLKIVLIAALALFCVLVLLPKGKALLPDFVQQQAGYLRGHIQLLLRDKVQYGFADAGSIINELQGQNLQHLAFRSHAMPIFFYVSVICLPLLFWKRRVAFLYLLPFWGLGVLSLQNVRFTLLFLPASMLCLGFGSSVLYHWIAKRRAWYGKYVPAGSIVLTCLLAGVLFAKASKATYEPGMQSLHDYLAEQTLEHSPSDTLVWSWWDTGYFWQYAAQRNTYFDGGSQSPLNMFVVGYALRSPDAQLARNWIRFFSAHGSNALYRLQARLGGMPAAITFLEDIFTDPGLLEQSLESISSITSQSPEDYFFPHVSACLILPLDILEDSAVWYYYGTPEFFLKMETRRKRLFSHWDRSAFTLDRSGLMHTDHEKFPIASRLTYGDSTLPRKISLMRSGTHLLLESEHSPRVWVADMDLTRTIAFQLMFPQEEVMTGQYFKKIDNRIGVGGVWMVK